MAQHILTQQQLEDLFWQITKTITGFDDEFIRITFSEDGQPAYTIVQNLAFITVTCVDDPYDKLLNTIYRQQDSENVEQEVSYTRVFRVDWTLVGRTAYDNSDSLRFGVLTESIRQVLAESQVFPIPRIKAPSRMPYNNDGQWWERSDIQVYFNVATVRTAEIPYLVGAEIQIHDEQGLQRDFQIEE